jgi:hypothetical protein
MAPLDSGGDLPEIDRRLRDHVAELVEHLRGEAPNKALSNRHTVRFGRKGGLAVDINGPNKGRITDFNDGGNKAQSPFQFIQSEIGGDFAGAFQWAKAWLGIEGERPEPRVRQEDPKSSSAEAEQEEAERRAKVGQIVGEARNARDTPAEAYLRGRGITTDLPPAARWRPKAWGRYGSLVLAGDGRRWGHKGGPAGLRHGRRRQGPAGGPETHQRLPDGRCGAIARHGAADPDRGSGNRPVDMAGDRP